MTVRCAITGGPASAGAAESPGRRAAVVLLAALCASPLAAQQREPQREPEPLPAVQVTVTRDAARSPLELPFSITTITPDSARPGLRHVALDETLFLLPGVAAVNRNNPSQDPRLSIRGFGARSAFGVRGVRIVRDGVPLTLPDGQTPVDYLDLESVGAVEVIRGSASALYGNAAGGVISIRSSDPPAGPLAVELRALGGEAGFRRGVLAAGGTLGRVRYQGDVSRGESDGSRQHARQRTTAGFARVMTRAAGTDLALQVMLFDMPLAENPGALTLAELRANPDSAQALAVRKRARKEVQQGQVGLTAMRALRCVGAAAAPGAPTAGAQAASARTADAAETECGEAEATLYGGRRDLYNPLTFAIVDLDRVSYGASVRAAVPVSFLGLRHRVSAGVDLQRQDDDRLNYENCNPPAAAVCDTVPRPFGFEDERGVLRLDQREIVSSVGPYVRDEVRLGARYRLMLGARADYVRFALRDRFVHASNPDDSGERTLRAVSPMAGVTARLGLLHAAYANVSTAFETPTTNELGNQPDGSAGLNRDLEPQRATTYEVGARGVLASRVRYDVAAFQTHVRGELIQTQVQSGPNVGRSYFRNAGRTRRRGAEVGLAAVLGPVDLAASYTYSHFVFTEYARGDSSFAGNRIPGVPVQQLQGSATARWRTFFWTTEAVLAGGTFANDANTARVSGYEVLNLRAGGRAAFGRPWLSAVVGVQNLFGRRYVPSVAVNAAQGRYYEPAPGRLVYAGLTIGAGR